MRQPLFVVDNDNNIRENIKCTACSLWKATWLRTNCMEGVGPEGAMLMFVGMAPGQEDDREGVPMTGWNGRLFHDYLRKARIRSEDIFITNSLKCCFFEKEPTQTMFNACSDHLKKELRRIKPKAVVAVGAKALTWLTGFTGIGKARRRSLPCVLDKDMPVYAITQPLAVQKAEGAARDRMAKELVDDLRWIADTVENGGESKNARYPTDYKTAYTVQDVEEFIEELKDAPQIACDLETTDLFPEEGQSVVAIGFSKARGHGRAIPILAPGLKTTHWWNDEEFNTVIKLVKPILEHKSLFGHNFLQFDQKWIDYIWGVRKCKVDFDTQCAHYLLDEERGHRLEQLAVQFGEMDPWKSEFTVKDTVKCCTYLAKDVDATFRLREVLEPELKTYPKLWWILHNQLIPLSNELREMEQRGVVIDQIALDKLDKYLYSRIQESEQKLKEMECVKTYELQNNSNFNPNASQQVAIIMEKILKLRKVEATGSGGYSTGKATQEEHKNNPFVAALVEYRQLSKLRGTYCEGIKERIRKDGRLHTSFIPHFTVTGRLASRDPNLQNIPRDDTAGKILEDAAMIKNIFVASGPNRVLLQGDLSQIELRILAVVSGDTSMIQAYKDGKDLHQAAAAKIYGIPYDKVSKGQRSNSKNCNFGIVYGMSFQSLLSKFLVAGNTEEEAASFYHMHQQTFPSVWSWIAEQSKRISEYGWQENYLGRRRRYSQVDNKAERQASNFPIQSGAAEVTSDWIIRAGHLLREYEFDAYPVLTVHDSLAVDCLETEMWDVAEIMKITAETPRYEILKDIPIKVDMEAGYAWGSMRKIDIEKREYIK